MKIATACVCCGGQTLSRSPAILMPFVANRVFGWEPVQITPDWGLRTIPAGLAYPLCNSLQCDGCGLVFLDMRFDGDEMAALYAGYRGPDYARQRDRFEPGYLAQNADILARPPEAAFAEAFLNPVVRAQPAVLDWGGDTGAHTPFRTAGGDIWVHDVSGQPLMEGVRQATQAGLGAQAFDLVVLSHILEHTPWPAAVLDEVKAAMSAATLLYVEVPFEALMSGDAGAGGRAADKKHWHEHINFFTEDALRRLLERSGLIPVKFERLTRASHANFSQVLAVACRLGA